MDTIKGHLENCPAKNRIFNICKKIIRTLCYRLQMRNATPKVGNTNANHVKRQRKLLLEHTLTKCTKTTNKRDKSTQYTSSTTRKLTNVHRGRERNKTIDPESTCYVREMMEDWKAINFINSLNFSTTKITSVNGNKQ